MGPMVWGTLGLIVDKNPHSAALPNQILDWR